MAVPSSDDLFVAGLLARCSMPTEGDLHVACSGGPDSTALLALAVAAVERSPSAPGGPRRVLAHHVDHGLRPGSDAEADHVAALARRWGADPVSHVATVPAGANLEERCRVARHAALPAGTLFGHTADDLAETVLLRILRGTGPAGLAAMSVATHPILGLRRHETAALCAHLGVVPLVDPTNDDPAFTRNRVRAEVLPLLDDVAGRDVVPLLCRLADLAGEQAEVLGGLVATVDATDARALAALPPALAREALRRWWRETTELPPPDSAALARMVGVSTGERRSCDVVGGWRLERSGGRLRLAIGSPP